MINIDDSQVQDLFNALDSDTCKDILFKALRKGGKQLSDQTKINLRASGIRTNTPNRWNGKTMESGISLKADKDYCEVSVSILKDFILPIFEKGNYLKPNRPTKKGYSRGNITPINFFRRARQEDISGTIENYITESLNRINR